MEKTIDHKQLYALQDEVLAIVFALENSFYLTGGTALHRFYYKARYSNCLITTAQPHEKKWFHAS